ncbi:MAG: deiodinase family protein, partial [Gemmataceae bacterium]
NFSNTADAPSTWTLLRGLTRNEIGSTFPGANVGDTAPNFTLKTMDGKKEVTLADYRGKTPVVLVFGNYSCGPFRFQYRAVEELQRIYGEKVTFLAIYIREAHPTEGWKMASNEKMGVRVAQPRTDEDRAAVATQCAKALNMTMPVLVDTVADTVGHAYSGMPSRLVLIDTAGKLVFKSGRGPFGFRPQELDQAIALLQTEERLARRGRITMLTDDETWKRLPERIAEVTAPLPSWAKMLALPLPRTTAAMLELDFVQRAESTLAPQLRAEVRRAVAHANRCEYSIKVAEADLARLPAAPPLLDRATAMFVEKLTREASRISDAEFATVRAVHGDTNMVGIVLAVAYGCFQDRLLLSLGVTAAEEDLLPPVAVRF